MGKKNYFKIGFAVLFLSLLIVAYFLGFQDKFSLSYVQEHHQKIQIFIAHHSLLSIIFYLFIYIACVILMLPITLILNIASGYFFGVLPGTFYSVVGSVIGSLVSFLIFRYILREWAQKKYHKKLISVEKDFDKHGVGYLLSLQLFPITPFAVINIIAGLSKIPAWKYAIITMIGVTPYTFLYALAGRKLIELNSLNDIFSPWFIVLSLGLSLCALAPTLYHIIKTKLKKNDNDSRKTSF